MASQNAGPMDENRLLAALPQGDYRDLRPSLSSVHVRTNQTVIRAQQPIPYVYFPRSGLYSLLLLMEDGGTMEGAAAGREGMLGLSVFLEADPSPFEIVCQIPGELARMPAPIFKEAVESNRVFHRLLHRYTLAAVNQLARTAACNRFHSVEQRLARWLLLCRDRAGADEFPLTHEALAGMLGVRRASITDVVAILERDGLIRRTRGRISILRGEGLEAVACEDYRLTIQEYRRLLG